MRWYLKLDSELWCFTWAYSTSGWLLIGQQRQLTAFKKDFGPGSYLTSFWKYKTWFFDAVWSSQTSNREISNLSFNRSTLKWGYHRQTFTGNLGLLSFSEGTLTFRERKSQTLMGNLAAAPTVFLCCSGNIFQANTDPSHTGGPD